MKYGSECSNTSPISSAWVSIHSHIQTVCCNCTSRQFVVIVLLNQKVETLRGLLHTILTISKIFLIFVKEKTWKCGVLNTYPFNKRFKIDWFQLLTAEGRRDYLTKLPDFLNTDNNRNWRFREELAGYVVSDIKIVGMGTVFQAGCH